MATNVADPQRPFSEKNFYLAEFRGRTLAMALPRITRAQLPLLRAVLDDFSTNATRVVLIGADSEGVAEELVTGEVVSASDPRWVGSLWHELRASGCALLRSEAPDLAELCRRVALQLGLAKLVWVDAQAVLKRADDGRLSFLDLSELERLLAGGGDERAEQLPLLREIRNMIAGGLPSVSICSAEGLADELFTYGGSGTFFTRKRAPDVRALVIDDFDAAHDLIGHGVREGYLVERSPREIEDVLTNGFGVFVEGRYLAGIGALIPHASDNASEIVSLYTLTRFLGEGVGGHLVRFALQRARAEGHRFVFACTTSERVEGFFVRHGFERADPEQIPADKWKRYPPERRRDLRCVLHTLSD